MGFCIVYLLIAYFPDVAPLRPMRAKRKRVRARILLRKTFIRHYRDSRRLLGEGGRRFSGGRGLHAGGAAWPASPGIRNKSASTKRLQTKAIRLLSCGAPL